MRSAHYDALAVKEPVLAQLIEAHGRPDPFAWNDGGRTGSDDFAAMVLHIVSQQISTAAALGPGGISDCWQPLRPRGGLNRRDGPIRFSRSSGPWR